MAATQNRLYSLVMKKKRPLLSRQEQKMPKRVWECGDSATALLLAVESVDHLAAVKDAQLVDSWALARVDSKADVMAANWAALFAAKLVLMKVD